MTTITLNHSQRQYVLTSDDGETSLDFDAIYDRLKQYASLLGRPQPDAAAIGTYPQYLEYLEAEIGILARYRQDLEAERAYIAGKLQEELQMTTGLDANDYTVVGVTEEGQQKLLHVTAVNLEDVE